MFLNIVKYIIYMRTLGERIKIGSYVLLFLNRYIILLNQFNFVDCVIFLIRMKIEKVIHIIFLV